MTPEDVQQWCAEQGHKPFRAKQILEWAYRHGAASFDAMSNLPKKLRQTLADGFNLYQTEIETRQESNDGTVKLLLRWPDGSSSECVMIPDGKRRTACISSQVGCPVKCTFCASGIDGLERNLTAGQIVEQAMRISQVCGPNARLSNVVYMGLGEPLANYDAMIHSVRTINADWGMGIGARKITVSTVGLPSRIHQLADDPLQITLAISLHAPDDALRRTLIPWAERVTIAELTAAANAYFYKKGREVTLEYILLAGVNDHIDHARQLAKIARNMRSNVNLIRYNPVDDLGYDRPGAPATIAFQKVLQNHGVTVHVRRSRGTDIDGACGQLRRQQNRKAVPLNVNIE